MKKLKSILLATGNAHKVEEVATALAPLGIEVRGLGDGDVHVDEPIEDRPTFMGNALLKARYYAQHVGGMVMADDSGLVVDALGGEPGVRSARYSGATGERAAVDAANNALLLERLAGVEPAQRAGRFVCVMAMCDAAHTLAVARGTVEGAIVTEPRGSNGFGYDPLFEVASLGRTAAELSPTEKSAVSHRGDASRRMAAIFKRLASA